MPTPTNPSATTTQIDRTEVLGLVGSLSINSIVLVTVRVELVNAPEIAGNPRPSSPPWSKLTAASLLSLCRANHARDNAPMKLPQFTLRDLFWLVLVVA